MAAVLFCLVCGSSRVDGGPNEDPRWKLIVDNVTGGER